MPDNSLNQQNQSQSQNTSVQVTIESSSDPALERRIFSNIASTGRRLGRIVNIPPAEAEERYYAQVENAAMAA